LKRLSFASLGLGLQLHGVVQRELLAQAGASVLQGHVGGEGFDQGEVGDHATEDSEGVHHGVWVGGLGGDEDIDELRRRLHRVLGADGDEGAQENLQAQLDQGVFVHGTPRGEGSDM
jgi:hypothetical protein